MARQNIVPTKLLVLKYFEDGGHHGVQIDWEVTFPDGKVQWLGTRLPVSKSGDPRNWKRNMLWDYDDFKRKFELQSSHPSTFIEEQRPEIIQILDQMVKDANAHQGAT